MILLIPLIFLLPQLFADKVLGVFLAEPVADILAASTTGILFFWRFPKDSGAPAAGAGPNQPFVDSFPLQDKGYGAIVDVPL